MPPRSRPRALRLSAQASPRAQPYALTRLLMRPRLPPPPKPSQRLGPCSQQVPLTITGCGVCRRSAFDAKSAGHGREFPVSCPTAPSIWCIPALGLLISHFVTKSAQAPYGLAQYYRCVHCYTRALRPRSPRPHSIPPWPRNEAAHTEPSTRPTALRPPASTRTPTHRHGGTSAEAQCHRRTCSRHALPQYTTVHMALPAAGCALPAHACGKGGKGSRPTHMLPTLPMCD